MRKANFVGIKIGYFNAKDTDPIITKKYLSVKQVAIFLGVTPKTIYKWVHNGNLVPERIGSKLMRFDLEKIQAWITCQQQPPRGRFS